MEPDAVPQKDTGTVLAEQRTGLALHRTVIAAERTLMAWIRTTLSMIGFGFTIYKFFEYMDKELETLHALRRPHAPRNLGMTMVGLGTLALIVAAWQHRLYLNQIGATEKRHIWSLAFVMAILVSLIGAIVFYGALLSSGPF